MIVVHKLYSSVRMCKETRNTINNDEGGLRALDVAIAYWIGDSQVTGSADKGHLLYAFTEGMGEMYGQDSTGQTNVNRRMLDLFNQAKDQITFTNACTLKTNSHVKLKHIVDDIVSVMSIPLLRSLIKALYENDKDRVKLYAVSVIPMVAGCDETSYESLRDILIENEYDVSKFNHVIGLITNAFPCMGVKCEDIGVYMNKVTIKCTDPSSAQSLAGYVPSSDFRQQAKFDLDLQQIAIFMEMKAHEAAIDLYTMGKNNRNGDDWRTLHYFASTNEREIIPQYLPYRLYFDNYDYADKFVTNALTESAPFDVGSFRQKAAVVNDTLRYMVMHMQFLRKVYESLNACYRGGSLGKHSKPWDEAVAYYTGTTMDSHKGNSLYALSQRRCGQFNTCESDRVATVNKQMLILFYAGQSEMRSLNCAALDSTVSEIKYLVLVPLIQSSLHYAIENEAAAVNSRSATIASGFVFSQSLLPLLNEVDEEAADVIRRNFEYSVTAKPVQDGAEVVFEAYKDALSKIKEFDCRLVGKVGSMNVCAEPFSVSSSNDALTIVGVVLLVIGNIAVCVLAFVLCSKYANDKGIDHSEAEELLEMEPRESFGVVA